MMGYTDIHTHILYDADDGSADTAESLRMLRSADADGTAHILATPHFKSFLPHISREELLSRVDALNALAAEHGLSVQVYPGNEIYADSEGIAALLCGDALPLANSRYVLLEITPVFSETAVLSIFRHVLQSGFVPILAHVERSVLYPDKLAFLQRLTREGALLQIDAEALSPKCGLRTFLFVKKLIRENLVFAVASDGHNDKHRPVTLSAAYRRTAKLFGADTARLLFCDNPGRVLQNTHF